MTPKTYKFKVYNLDTKKPEIGSFFISDEGDLYEQIIHGFEICIEPVKFKYEIKWES